EEPPVALPGTSLEMKTTKDGTLVQLEAHAKADFGLPSPPVAPTVEGATLLVSDVGAATQQAFELPAAGWKGLGRPKGKGGYKFASKGGPCTKAKLKATHLSARCLASALTLPAVGDITIEFVSSSAKRYCGAFGGLEKRNDDEKLKRVQAPPSPCPAP